MKTLLEIVREVADGEVPHQDDLRYAVLVLNHLGCFERDSLLHLARLLTAVGGLGAAQAAEVTMASSKRLEGALGTSPKEWIGWNNDPDNEEFQETRTRAAPHTIH
jgi:hypothetical protein